jgi:MGT family glycosyltransferase
MTQRPLTVLFMPESAYGPTNNCIGIGDVLRRRGHRVVFAAESSWQGKLEKLGFEEDLVALAPAARQPVDPGQFWKDFIRTTAQEFRRPTIEQLDTWVRPAWQELIAGARYCESQLRGIIARARPDIVVLDNVVTFPALLTAGVPYVRIVSCNPLELKGPLVPPAFSGYPVADRSGWSAFRAEYGRTHRPIWRDFNAWVLEQGAPALPELEFVHSGQDLNLYIYPGVADYTARRPLGPSWHRLESSVRATDELIELPEKVRDGEGSLIYFSLGSLGSNDVELIRRVLKILGETPHRYVVSLGPLHAELEPELPPTIWGQEFLPQTTLLPLVDLVITHGGNNTITECFHFGKPMIVLPLFWDQYDNAQRVHELGYGVRLDTYRFGDDELRSAIDRLLGDEDLRSGMAATAREIRGRHGTERAADLLETTARRAAFARP